MHIFTPHFTNIDCKFYKTTQIHHATKASKFVLFNFAANFFSKFPIHCFTISLIYLFLIVIISFAVYNNCIQKFVDTMFYSFVL